MKQPKKIFLVGPMGAGKSAVGRYLARELHLTFADSDDEVESRTGVDIPFIFEKEGEAGFRKGMDLYFERHDGAAVTCDDFLAAMADANDIDLAHFGRWYGQSGTPVVRAKGAYDAARRQYTLTLGQHTPPTLGQPDKQSLTIPIAVGLLTRDGRELEFTVTRIEGDVLVGHGSRSQAPGTGADEFRIPFQDVALVQVTPPDEHGFCSLGVGLILFFEVQGQQMKGIVFGLLAGVTYAGNRWQVRGGFYGSWFSNKNLSHTWENAFTGPDLGRMAGAPDNKAYNVNLAGSFRLFSLPAVNHSMLDHRGSRSRASKGQLLHRQ